MRFSKLCMSSLFVSMSTCESSKDAVDEFEFARLHLYAWFSVFSGGLPIIALSVDDFLLSKVLKQYAYAHIEAQLRYAQQALEFCVFATAESLDEQLQLDKMRPGQIAVCHHDDAQTVSFLLLFQDKIFHKWQIKQSNAPQAYQKIRDALDAANRGEFNKLDCSAPLFHSISSELKHLAYCKVLSDAEFSSALGAVVGMAAAVMIISACIPPAFWALAILLLAGFTAAGLLLGTVAGCNSYLPTFVEAEQEEGGSFHQLFRVITGGGEPAWVEPDDLCY